MQKFLFTEGLDKDTDVRLVKPTTYRDAENIRIRSMDGKNFIVTKIKGNTKKENDLNDNIYNVIGSYDDKLGQRVFYFITARDKSFVSSQDAILEYNYSTNTTTTLLRGDLGFNVNNKITGIALVDNKHLCWTDDLKEPRILDITQLDRFVNGIVDSSNERLLELAKSPLLTTITAQYTTDTTKDTNNLRGRSWQFAVIFTYKDGGRSIMSSYSNVPLPSNVIEPYFGSNNTTQDNQIVVSFNKPSSDINKVELCVRSKTSDEAPTEWWVTKSWTGDELDPLSTNISHNFYNDGFEKFVDNNEVIQLGCAVPQKSKALELSYGNRLFMANIVEGFNLPKPNASLTWKYNLRQSTTPASPSLTATVGGVVATSEKFIDAEGTDINLLKVAQAVFDDSRVSFRKEPITNSVGIFFPFEEREISRRDITFSGTPSIGDIVTINFRVNQIRYAVNANRTISLLTPLSTDYTLIYLVREGDTTIETLTQNIALAFNGLNVSAGDVGKVVAQSVEGTNILRIYTGGFANLVNTVFTFASSDVTTANVTISNANYVSVSTPTFKRERRHEFCINYYDIKGRKFSAITSPNLQGTPLSWKDESARGSVNAQISIAHTPPTEAVAYSIGHRSQNFSFVEFFTKVEEVGSTKYGNFTYYAYVDGLISYNGDYADSVLNYTYERGDMIEIYVSEFGTDMLLATKAPIQEFDTANNRIIFTQTSDSTITGSYLVCITKANSAELTQPFAETGKMFPISEGKHNGNIQNQTDTQPASVLINWTGDCFYRLRLFVDLITKIGEPAISGVRAFWVEDESVSDFYLNTATSAGKPNVVDPNFTQTRKETAVVFTEPYVVEGFINGLSTVYDSSIEVYTSEHGSIQHLYSRGRVLEVYMQRRVGAIGIQQANALGNGGAVIYDTSSVLTDMEYYTGEYGIGNHPESFSVYGNSQYFVDDIRGVVCRKAENGIIPISEYNMVSEFNKLLRNPALPIKSIVQRFDRNNYELITSVGSEVYIDSFLYVPQGADPSVSIIKTTADVSQIAIGDTIDVLFNALNTPVYLSCLVTQKQGNVSGEFTITVSHENPFVNNWELRVAAAIRKQINTTYSFYERENFWVSKLSYQPEWMEELNTSLCSFRNGVLYTHDTNSNINEFYGIIHPSKLTLIANENPSFPKRFKSIQEEGTHKWTVPSITTNTPSGANRSLLQQSNLTASNLKHVSNMFVSGFWKDINTVNVNNPRFEGNDLRGQYATLTLENNDNADVELFSVGVNYIVTDVSNSE